MEIKGIDVSAWQGQINWDTVADYGMGFVILRITEAGNVIDSCFEKNYSECQKHNIPTGVYKYSYAMTVSEIESEARKVVSVLAGRKLQYPVWLDLEWNNQRTLGSESIHKLAEAFEKIITAAGYQFGIYCNVDWYLNVICSHLKKYDLWIARYPAADNGTLQERLRPGYGVGWQYSSKAKIPGIPGTVDRNVFYKDYSKEEETMVKLSNCGHDENGRYAGGKAGDQTGTEYQIINWYNRPWMCVLRFEDQKVASLIADMAEKAARNDLIGYDQGTAGNTNDRYTFWRHLKASNYDPAQITVACESDCSASTAAIVKGAGYRLNLSKLKAVSIYLTTYNMRQALKTAGATVLTDEKYLTSGDYLKAGDILLNDNHHVAIAVTSGAKAESVKKVSENTYQFTPNTVKAGDKNTSVLLLQEILRARGFKGKNGKTLKLTWSADANTIYALKAYQESRKEVLEVDGICGPATWKDLIAI
jgi:GH25 family lysozyme M1 (1,4-beta-N-acetylmuramidase)